VTSLNFSKFFAKKGIELAITSSYRSYEDQKIIWNNKVLGTRAVLDSHSNPVDISKKTKEELLFLILRWTALFIMRIVGFWKYGRFWFF
jgi:hypothetical protein